MRATPLLFAVSLLTAALAVLGWVFLRSPQGAVGLIALISAIAALGYMVLAARRQQEHLEEVEQALKRSQVRAMALIDASPDGILLVHDARVVFSNPALRSLLAIPPDEELIGREWTSLLAPHQREVAERWMASRQAGEPVATHRELQGQRVPGVELPLWASTALLPAEQGGRQVALFLRDLSSRQLLQARVAHAARLEAVADVGERLVREFEQIFRRIRDLTHGAGDEQTPPHEEPLLSIERAASRGAALARRARALAPASADTSLHQSLDVTRLVRDTAADFLRTLTPPHTLRVELTEAEPMVVRGDAASLRSAVWQLLLNAREAQAGGEIVVALHSAVLSSEDVAILGVAPGRYATIEVTDHGAGMAPEVRERAFAPFFTTKGPHAAGLGLTVAYGIARSHRGFIELESTAGRGTTAQLTLPLTDAEDALVVVTAVDPRQRWRGRETVLIVDDDLDAADALRRQLEQFGYHAETVNEPRDAMQRLRHRPSVDLVLLDMVLPGRNGNEVLSRILKHWPGQRVLMICPYPLPDQEEAARRLGALGNLHRPLHTDALAQAVRSALDQPPPAPV